VANVDVALSDAFRVVDLIGVFANAALGGVPAQVVPARYRKRLRARLPGRRPEPLPDTKERP